MFALEVKHWVLIVPVVMEESYKVQSDKCQWLSGVNLSFQYSNWVFFPLWLKKKHKQQSKCKWILRFIFLCVLSVLFTAHSFPPVPPPPHEDWRTKTPKLCIKSQVAGVKSQLSYNPLCIFGCSWLHVSGDSRICIYLFTPFDFVK